MVDSGSFGHAHPQQGQPLVDCTGSFELIDPATGEVVMFELESSGFFPAGQ